VGRGDYAYQPFVSITGRESNGGFCCADERFRADVCRWAARAAEAGAELIVLDDDWRMNAHGDGIWPGCLCPDHLRRYRERVGEDLTIEEIADRVFTGGGSRYRDAWRDLMGDDLRRLAREIREAVDRMNPACRIGICAAPTSVGMDGADFMEIADALAGDNDPYVRLIGAPYWAKSGAELAGVVTLERMQAHQARRWAKDTHGGHAEVLLEGDVYPRPRFVTPSAYLECADLICRADGCFTGAMKYMMDYASSPRYEHGYIDRHVKNAPLAREIEALFAGSRGIGFVPLEDPAVFRRMRLPDGLPFDGYAASYEAFRGLSIRSLTGACVPISFEDGIPVLFGENARCLADHPGWERALRYGAVLDARAAEILTEAGYDVGAACFGESVGAGSPERIGDEIVPFAAGGRALRMIVPKPEAEILTRFADDSPAVFRYENPDGARFLVYPIDPAADVGNTFFRSYTRHRELTEQGRWIGEAYPERIRIPADCAGNPDLYLMEAVRGNTVVVGLWNLFPDAIEEPVVTLESKPASVRFVGCGGEIDGHTIRLTRIEPFGFAGFAYEIQA
ncbi:MAG: hypothetical protein IKX19_03650, partial [Clostridia bacterium]|nr:hypothetical protein [Clostridia bacterium]